MIKTKGYSMPHSLAEALDIMKQQAGRYNIIAGGTDLVIRLKGEVVTPDTLIDVSEIPELKGIREENGALVIGAAVTHDEIANSPLVKEKAAALAEASHSVGAPQIRYQGTIGGNMGNASPAGDTIPALFALNASVKLVGANGERVVPITGFFTGPGRTVMNGEVIVSVAIPLPAKNARSAFVKLGRRNSLAISINNAAVYVEMDGGVVKNARVGLGSVAPTVVRAPKGEAYLAGKQITEEVLAEFARIVENEVKPISDLRASAEYRREMAGTVAKQALEKAIGK